MQLISLELEAFLPFKEHIFLDFSVVNEDKIFLITGNTGAGKTSIFDAICFALYGEASGSERDSTRLKSQFSDDSTECFVTLTFLNKGARYKIRRTPIQDTLKRTGNITSNQASAVLEFESGEILSRKNEVDAKIIQILGINSRQFKKIVMLPQGEFRKFLTDSSTDKQTLLRHIFGTEYFAQFAELLKERFLNIEQEKKRLEIERNSLANQLNPLSNEKLSAEIKSENRDFTAITTFCEELILAKQNDVKILRSQVKSATENLSKLNFSQAEIFNQKLSEYNSAKKSLKLLEGNSEEISSDKAVVKKLFSVKEVILEKTQFETASKNAAEFLAAVKLKNLAAEAGQIELEKAKTAYNAALNQQELSAKKAVLIQNLEQSLLLFDEQKAAKAKLVAAETAVNTAKHNLEMLSTKTQLDEDLLLESRLSKSLLMLEDLDKKSLKAQDDFTKWQSAYSEFLSSQAYFLSLTLSENSPCPVCGSVTHPRPATASSNSLVTREILDALSAKQENSRKSLEQVKSTCHSCRAELNLLENDFTVTNLNALLCTTKERIKSLKLALSDFSFDFSTADELKEISALKAAEKVAAATKLSEIKAKIADNHLDEKKIKSEISLVKAEIKSAEKELSVSSRLLEKARNSCEKATSELDKTSALSVKYSEEKSEHQLLYNSLLEKYSLTESNLKALSDKLLTLDFLQEKIEQHDKSLAAMTQAVEQGKADFEGKDLIDLTEIKLKINEWELEKKRATKEYETAIKVLDSNSKILKQLKKIDCDFAKVSKTFAQADMLYKVCTGRYGDKISFERYVLRSYFELVISCANDRLIKMTDGRYFLRRRGIKESGNTSSGLELEVFDAHCCKFRHVNSLSGGEGFKASLCLALGLADVISQKSGGIELDTIFIDEGFGTLDPAALDSAIECLYSLKNHGRTIGIISHVRELSEKIPVKLNVFAGKIGSTAQFTETSLIAF